MTSWVSYAWLGAMAIYVGLALLSGLPVLSAIFRKIELHPGGPAFDKSIHFSEPAREKLHQHYQRIQGTLAFWKKQAEKYKRAHYYCLFWTIPSAVVIPFLVQASSNNPIAKWLITIISAYSAILLALHRALKIAENYRAFREGESNFYDTYRRMLDRPYTFGDTENAQLDRYFDEVENLRKFVRNAETDNTPSLEQAKSQVSNEKPAPKLTRE
ncbi:DUF4231 domain-containing protein [Rhizobium laguerreae]|uniref:DUF4231 domain-containing protein n=1 Tax=Rhizobium laguerreae TaxID=1076926 RepID=UPI00144177F3|nr:DUF4231 domain-containing protein [Rhizobium laguerreae]NKN15263.1 DUF4231 domain-containing protein [Rhizobium laguerreae]